MLHFTSFYLLNRSVGIYVLITNTDLSVLLQNFIIKALVV